MGISAQSCILQVKMLPLQYKSILDNSSQILQHVQIYIDDLEICALIQSYFVCGMMYAFVE